MKTILAAVDFSVVAPAVFADAERLARATDARLLVLHVIPIPPAVTSGELCPGESADLLTATKRDADLQMEVLLRPKGGRSVESLTLRGGAADEILRMARERKCTYIVLGSHAAGAGRESVLSGTSREVVIWAPCPVLLVPPRAGGQGLTSDPRKSILAPIDFSVASPAVVAAAADLALALSARVVLFYAERPIMVVNDYARSVAQNSLQPDSRAATALEGFRGGLNRRGIEAEIAQVFGPPVEQIVAKAAELRPEYIVMGSHGHGAIYDLLMGSTTAGVIKRAAQPVVLVGANLVRQSRSAPVATEVHPILPARNAEALPKAAQAV